MLKKFIYLSYILIIAITLGGLWHFTSAQTVDELQQKIQSNSSQIQQLRDEIAQLSGKLSETSAQRKTLQNAINTLELNSKKLQAQIDLTQKQIGNTDVQIQQLSITINAKSNQIQRNKLALAETLQHLNEQDGLSVIETMFIYPDISTFAKQVEATGQFQATVKDKLDDLQNLKHDLEVNKGQTEEKKTELVTLKSQLDDQNKIIAINKNEKDKLLTVTKSQESAYQKMIADKKAKEAAFEKELNDFQSQLHILLDPSKIPGAQAGVLAWPTQKHTITQYFGNTDFSQTHAAVYSGHGHNGIDIGVPLGTPIMAAGVGTIMGTGDTDLTCPGASFGRWVMIQHNNGLSTLYAHLSVIKASKGATVQAGDIIGYSGMTGYATGPHLHFTVYATQGVEILSRASAACGGKVYVMPIADLKAYLNPLDYL